jgi:outer membrane lipopolysaccharide assembly protein LptE/RlpB
MSNRPNLLRPAALAAVLLGLGACGYDAQPSASAPRRPIGPIVNRSGSPIILPIGKAPARAEEGQPEAALW